jgi:hypothetical protein
LLLRAATGEEPKEDVMRKNWVLALALATVSLAPVASFADDYYYRDRNWHDSGDNGAYQRGYERGLQEGRQDGWSDGRHRDRFDFWSQGDYRDGDKGYKRWYGPRPVYVSGFRRGYEESYRQGYRSAAERYNHGWRWSEERRYNDRDRW